MIVSILASHSGECQFWKIPVTVSGWYGQHQDGPWSFLRAECPIIENSKLPREEQQPEMRMMSCPGSQDCPLFSGFQSHATKDI